MIRQLLIHCAIGTVLIGIVAGVFGLPFGIHEAARAFLGGVVLAGLWVLWEEKAR